jgi:hypothetical protein
MVVMNVGVVAKHVDSACDQGVHPGCALVLGAIASEVKQRYLLPLILVKHCTMQTQTLCQHE